MEPPRAARSHRRIGGAGRQRSETQRETRMVPQPSCRFFRGTRSTYSQPTRCPSACERMPRLNPGGVACTAACKGVAPSGETRSGLTIPCPPRGCLIGCIMASTLRRHSVTDGTAISLALLPRIEPIETNRRRRPAGGARGAVAASSTMSLRVDLARSNRPS